MIDHYNISRHFYDTRTSLDETSSGARPIYLASTVNENNVNLSKFPEAPKVSYLRKIFNFFHDLITNKSYKLITPGILSIIFLYYFDQDKARVLKTLNKVIELKDKQMEYQRNRFENSTKSQQQAAINFDSSSPSRMREVLVFLTKAIQKEVNIETIDFKLDQGTMDLIVHAKNQKSLSEYLIKLSKIPKFLILNNTSISSVIPSYLNKLENQNNSEENEENSENKSKYVYQATITFNINKNN